jgi:tRNA pseudouridine55 synthase
MILNVNKPIGWTSADVVRKVKRLTGGRKVGHGGTLDPFAEGVLIIGIDKDTKMLTSVTSSNKTYKAVLQLGAETDTLDVTGTVVKTKRIPQLSKKKIVEVFSNYTGELLQTPPAYSAKKVNGVRSYKIARQGKVIVHKPVTVHIYSLELLNFDPRSVCFSVTCSKGTYIRVLGSEIAKSLNTVGYLKELIRTSVGAYSLDGSKTISELEKEWKHISI